MWMENKSSGIKLIFLVLIYCPFGNNDVNLHVGYNVREVFLFPSFQLLSRSANTANTAVKRLKKEYSRVIQSNVIGVSVFIS